MTTRNLPRNILDNDDVNYDQNGLLATKLPEPAKTPMSQINSIKMPPIAVSPNDLKDHCHIKAAMDSGDQNKKARRQLTIASILCLIFMIGECIGGGIANSLAIMTDAAHLLTDFASFMISLFAIYLSAKPATKRLNFGWHRAEVIGALISVMLIWVVTGILVYLAIIRVIEEKYRIEGKVMLITSGIGIIINIIMALTLHQHGHGHSHGGGGGGSSHTHSHSHNHADDASHSHGNNQNENKNDAKDDPVKVEDNINVRAAFIHVIGDFVQSVGVFIASFIIYMKPQYKIADPICTFIFSFLVLITTVNILRDAIQVLMEGAPRQLEHDKIKQSLASVVGVIDVHCLRLWSLTMNRTAAAVHLATDPTADQEEILQTANRILRLRYHVSDVTIQVEQFQADMSECGSCRAPEK